MGNSEKRWEEEETDEGRRAPPQNLEV